MKICIGADHRGYELKNFLIQTLTDYSWIDEGTHTSERTDYPMYAHKVCKALGEGKAPYGILICGSGVGMAIAANRFRGIYAALCWNEGVARLAREDDGTNVLILPSDFVTHVQALSIFQAWITARFKDGRYQERLELIDKIK